MRYKAVSDDFDKYWSLLEDSVLRVQRKEKAETMREHLFTVREAHR